MPILPFILTTVISGAIIVESEQKLYNNRPRLEPHIVNFALKSNIPFLRRLQNFEQDQKVSGWVDEEELLSYYNDENTELTLLQKMARNWKRVAIRFIFLGSFILLIGMCCRCWCQTSCPFITSCIKKICCGWTSLFCKCCKEEKDPVFEKVQVLAKNLGIELTEETYGNIVKICEQQGAGIFQNITRK